MGIMRGNGDSEGNGRREWGERGGKWGGGSEGKVIGEWEGVRGKGRE